MSAPATCHCGAPVKATPNGLFCTDYRDLVDAPGHPAGSLVGPRGTLLHHAEDSCGRRWAVYRVTHLLPKDAGHHDRVRGYVGYLREGLLPGHYGRDVEGDDPTLPGWAVTDLDAREKGTGGDYLPSDLNLLVRVS